MNTLLNNIKLTANIDDLNESSNAKLSAIQIVAEGEIFGEKWMGAFQTSNTLDCAYVSSELELENDARDELEEILSKHIEIDVDSLLAEIKKQLNIQTMFDEYVKEHYVQNDDETSGIDANSENNELVSKS